MCEKGLFLQYNAYHAFCVYGSENIDFQEKGLFLKDLAGLGG